LVDGTKLADATYRKALWTGDRAAVEKADDTFIQLVRDIDAAAMAVRKRFDNDVSAVEQKNAELIAKVRFAMSGSQTYPDATGTLRLSYGAVEGCWNAENRSCHSQILPARLTGIQVLHPTHCQHRGSPPKTKCNSHKHSTS